MKRDLDLVRAILMSMEDNPDWLGNPQVANVSEQALRYHLRLLIDAGLVADESLHSQVFTTIAHRLTWDGHDFLDASREPKRWASAKRLLEGIGGASFEVVKSLLVKLASQQLGLPE